MVHAAKYNRLVLDHAREQLAVRPQQNTLTKPRPGQPANGAYIHDHQQVGRSTCTMEKPRMFGERSLELISSLKRAREGTLPPYNEDGIRQVGNCNNVRSLLHSAPRMVTLLQVLDAYNRLNTVKIRWDLGSVLSSAC